jgi:hypothetical protein
MLRSKFVRALCALVCAFGAVTGAHAQEDIAAQVLARLNQARADAGMPALTRSAQLDAAAQAHANDLRQNGVALGHRGSDGSTIKQRILGAGYASSLVGENWAAYRTLEQIMTFWLNDPPHRQNILDAQFREIGIGVAARASGGWIIVTDFGAPENAPARAGPAAPAARAPNKVRATPTRAKPAAPKPTRAPTRKATPKPTRAPKQAAPTPTAEPTRVALAAAPPPTAPVLLRARGRSARVVLHGRAAGVSGVNETKGDVLRMTLGAALASGGFLLFGIALVGQRRRRADSDYG